MRFCRHIFAALCLSSLMWISAGCGGPIDAPRSASPYLHSHVVDRIVFYPGHVEPQFERGEPARDREPIEITTKEDIRAVAFWLNETFHNRPVFDELDPALAERPVFIGKIRIFAVYGEIELNVSLYGSFEPMKRYIDDRPFRTQFQTMVDDRYPEESFVYVETVVVQYRGLYYHTYFSPRILTRPVSPRE